MKLEVYPRGSLYPLVVKKSKVVGVSSVDPALPETQKVNIQQGKGRVVEMTWDLGGGAGKVSSQGQRPWENR